MIRPVFLLTSFFLLSGCATTDWAAINKQVSDTAANLTKTLGGNSSGESGGMPLMSPAGQQAMQSVDKTFSVPVDVDTAAARLKRHYKFISTQELESMRQAANDGDWKAAAEDDAHPVWDAMPGSYYKMGPTGTDVITWISKSKKTGPAAGSMLSIAHHHHSAWPGPASRN